MQEIASQQGAEPVRKILLVEDNEPDAVYITRIIEKAFSNVQVTVVESLGEAHHAYKTQYFHLILLDLNLPDGFGPSTVREMKRFNKTIPIVALTGSSDDVALESALKNGASKVVRKSHLRDDFIKDSLNSYLV